MEILLLLVTLLPMLGALGVFLLSKASDDTRAYFSNIIVFIETVLCLLLIVQVMKGNELYYQLDYICGLGLSLKIDGFRALYALIASFMWLMTTVFTKEYLHHYKHKVRYMCFTLLTAGATVGVFLSADLFTTFIYFEIMSTAQAYIFYYTIFYIIFQPKT